MKSKKVKGEVLDLQNGAAFLSGVKIRGGTGLFFFLRNPSPGINENDSCDMKRTELLCPWIPGENSPSRTSFSRREQRDETKN